VRKIFQIGNRHRGIGAVMVSVAFLAGCIFAFGDHNRMKIRGFIQKVLVAIQAAICHFLKTPGRSVARRAVPPGLCMRTHASQRTPIHLGIQWARAEKLLALGKRHPTNS